MKVIETSQELILIRKDLSEKIAFVPTMGALHQGHLSLINIAKKHAEIIIVSIFINPLQFAPGEDLNKYPRTFQEDCNKLEELQVDYLFAPNNDHNWMTLLNDKKNQIKANEELSNCLCGLSRAGHFDGVCTVVKLLFDLVKPHCAIFGEKDYQQLMLIKSMVKEYKIDIEIISAAIVREKNGLAMSSRNKYLNEAEKEIAANIFKELKKIEKQESDMQSSSSSLENLGFKIEYLEKKWGRLFAAARLGQTRLIDNISMPQLESHNE